MYLVKSLSLGTRGLADTQSICPFRPTDSLARKGQIHCVSARPLVPREGLYQINGQSLKTHRGKHRSGGARFFYVCMFLRGGEICFDPEVCICKKLTEFKGEAVSVMRDFRQACVFVLIPDLID